MQTPQRVGGSDTGSQARVLSHIEPSTVVSVQGGSGKTKTSDTLAATTQIFCPDITDFCLCEVNN